MLVFGGREGDGKKRIVNDIFIFDTGKPFQVVDSNTFDFHRETTLVPA